MPSGTDPIDADALPVPPASGESLPTMIGYWDANLRNRSANEAYAAHFGRSAAEIEGRHIKDLLGPDVYEQHRGYIEAALAGEQQLFEREIRTPDGDLRTTQAAYLPDASGRPGGFWALVTDVTASHRQQQAMHAAEEQYRTLIEHLPGMAITLVGPDLRLQFLGGGVPARAELDADEIIGRPVRETAGGGEHGLLIESLYRRAAEGETVSTEVHSEVTGRDFSLKIAPLRDRDGTVTSVLGVAQDITDRLREQAQLRAAEQLFRTTVECAPVGIALVGLDFRSIRVNAALCDMLGYSESELLTMSHQDVSHPDELASDLEHVQRLLRGETASFSIEKRYIRADGSTMWGQLSVSLIRDDDGRPAHFVSQIDDITPRRQAAQDLERERRLLTEAQAFAQVGSWEYELKDGKRGDGIWSAQMWQILGREEQAATPPMSYIFDQVHLDDRARVTTRVQATIAAYEPCREEFRMVRPDGSTIYVELRCDVSFDDAGAAVLVLGTMQDVTRQRAAREQLRAATERAERIFDDAPIGMAVVTLDGRWERVNQALCRMMGYEEPELMARSLSDLTHPDDAEKDTAQHQRLLAGEIDAYQLEQRYVTGAGTMAWAMVSVSLLRDAEGRPERLIKQIEDVSERKRAEVALHLESQITENMAEGALLVREEDLLIVHSNAAADRMFGYEPGTLRGVPIAALNAATDQSPAAVAASIGTSVVDGGGTWSGEVLSVRRDGTEFWRHTVVSRYEHPDYGAVLVSVLTDVTERRERDAQERSLSIITALVAQGAEPEEVFTTVAQQVRELFDAHTAAVIRFDHAARHGSVVGADTLQGERIVGATVALDDDSASAGVFAGGHSARSGSGDGIAAPIFVAGALWGSVGAAFQGARVSARAEQRLTQFAEVIGLAIANAAAWDKLSREATTDALTGLANRRVFQSRLKTEVERAHRYGRSLSLVLLDVDHFKRVNDLHGHHAGDAVLIELARRLQDQVREGELIARVGGEEFAWLMPETDERHACLAAERIRKVVEATPFETAGPITISAGASASEPSCNGSELMRWADDALYLAKDSGRNRVRAASEILGDDAHAA